MQSRIRFLLTVLRSGLLMLLLLSCNDNTDDDSSVSPTLPVDGETTPTLPPTPGNTPPPTWSLTPGPSESPPTPSATSTPAAAQDQDGDGFTSFEDCDDDDPEIYSGAEEIPYDGIDQDCDGSDLIDVDGDGYDATIVGGDDCNDESAGTYPGAQEIADGQDNNCNGQVDEALDTKDDDEDGMAEDEGDCNDSDPSIYMGADEIPYDGVDQDCDGSDMTDVDGDGHVAEEAGGNDCDDQNINTYPGAIEFADGRDNDCDGEIDENLNETDDDGDGYAESDRDCNDSNASIHPGAEDIPYDGIDQDCDGMDLTDVDGDGYASSQVTGGNDCDDSSAYTYPGADETCDEADNNCDGDVDEGVQQIFYADLDADGHGDSNAPFAACSSPENASDIGDDCDDSNAGTYPGAEEQCDGADNDCNGLTDDGVTKVTQYPDADGDGYGAGEPIENCAIQDGYVTNGADCDDSDATVNPAASEVCDGVDNNCDGATDEGVTNTYYLDADADGYGSEVSTDACNLPEGYAAVNGDCDDSNADENPGANEVCNGQDDNCDGQVDEGFDFSDLYADGDGDGYGAGEAVSSCQAMDGYVTTAGDCDDSNPVVNPEAFEQCNGIDDNCNGQVDDNPVDPSTFYADSDGDGFGDPARPKQACSQPSGHVEDHTDCNDSDATMYPGRSETCDGKDNDCDGSTDEGVKTTYYRDADGDGYGNPSNTTQACSAPSGYVTNHTDCNDSDATMYPGRSETCDGKDNDCDGSTDEGVKTTYYRDADGDGYGNPSNTTQACSAPSGYVTNHTDCNDSDAAIYPGRSETCDGKDNDCDGSTDEGVKTTYYRDADGDGYGNPSNTTQACSAPSGYVTNHADCDDNYAWIHPGQQYFTIAEVYSSDRYDAMTTKTSSPEYSGQVEDYHPVTNYGPILGYTLANKPNGNWVALRRMWSPTHTDHCTITENQNTGTYCHNDGSYSWDSINLGYVRKDDLGNYTHHFYRVYKTMSDGHINHRQVDTQSTRDYYLNNKGYKDGGAAGWILWNNPACE